MDIKLFVDFKEKLVGNVSKVSIQDDVMDYLVDITNSTRDKDNIELGVSPI